jgi:diketogulonate reductase-like aldo/keto reductase
MTDIPVKKLNNSVEIPIVGLGTWDIRGSQTEEVLSHAFRLGYRHIDTAEMYGNEREIGAALKTFDREKIFITSKVSPDHLSYQQVLDACERSLEALGTGYIDLYLIHWPNSSIDIRDTMEAFLKLYKDKKIRTFGVSNFTIRHLEKTLPLSEELSLPVSVNQIEFHPLIKEADLLEFCRKNKITVTAYCPLAKGKVLNNPVIKALAGEKRKTPAQISLRWSIQKGNVVIPKASSSEHLAENADVFAFELTPEDMDRIDGIEGNVRIVSRMWD